MNASDRGSTPDLRTVRMALMLACRAPSVHNTQPWRWVYDGRRLNLYRDTSRLLRSADPQGRQLVISCGAVLDHARLAFVSMGWFADVIRLPDPDVPDHLAVLEFRPWPGALNTTAARVRAIHRRHTDRLPMLAPEGWIDVFDAARELARPHHVSVDEIAETSRPRLSAATEQAAALRRYDMPYQTELHWWTGHLDVEQGVPAAALVSDAEAARVDVGRSFPPAPYSVRRAAIEDRSRLIVLSTLGETPAHWLHTGEALSEILLECTARGLATCSLTHITELATSRSVIADLIPHPDLPQVLIRIGVAPEDTEPASTPRRPLDEVLELRTG
ncbi:Acg family FMN-binding oxidoreductase [Nocardia sp. NPDC052278]|uniref:Acg family FMN-binding oxidoreductase n=1 Tax=unclassified Nocardia TaxID=2637762 RepID=UPI0036B5ED45